MVYAIILLAVSMAAMGATVADVLETAAFVDYQWWHYLLKFLGPALLVGNGIWKLAEAIKERRELKKFLEGLPKDGDSASPN